MMTDQIVQTVDWVWRNLPALLPAKKEVERIVIKEVEEMLPQKGMLFVRLAGLSGATAVMLGAYGAHGWYSIIHQKNINIRKFMLSSTKRNMAKI